MSKLWGNSTWLLFHTISEKIKDDYFLKEKNNILNYITNICYNLPCPDCSVHATNFIKKKKFIE